IVVNGREKSVAARELTFAEIIRLAFENAPSDENTIFTVNFRRGHGEKPEGSLVDGGVVKVKEGMVFNVTSTTRS
ncbi:MAG TPA: multiubiquitin domain-containing protein, partial [Thermoanaerobaculia bacterium]